MIKEFAAAKQVSNEGAARIVGQTCTKFFADLGLNAQQARLYTFWVYHGIFRQTEAETRKFAELFKTLKKAVPPQHQDKVPSIVYRGMTFTSDSVKKFAGMKSIPLKARNLSSWTDSLDKAVNYASKHKPSSSVGLVLAEKVPPQQCLYLGPKFMSFMNQARPANVKGARQWHHNKGEVIVFGTGVPAITRKNLVKSFPAKS